MIRGRFEVPDGVVDGVIAVGVAAALLSAGASGPHAGTGPDLLGMRERVTALGGGLSARPRAEGGFTVRARLPLERSS